MRHYKKLHTKKFHEVKNEEKSFILTEDNNYNVGDTLVLDEFNVNDKATGNAIIRIIGYVERDDIGLDKGYCVLGLKKG